MGVPDVLGTLFLCVNIGNISKLVVLHNLTIFDIMSMGSNTDNTRKRGKPANMGKPVILRIRLKSGNYLQGVRVENEAPKIDGFLATVNKELPNSTKYINLNEIEYFTVVNQEACNVKSAFERRYKVKIDESL